jgi:Ser/Thr protein kinase RdoA (MazF antagonist)
MNSQLHHSVVSKSFLSTSYLASVVENEYGLELAGCQLVTATVRDVYLITSSGANHILYIYRHNHRSFEEVLSEWLFVDHLNSHGVPVSPAVRAKSDELVLTLDAPEGERHIVLTSFISGSNLRQRSSPEILESYARIVAQIHLLADDMPNKEWSRPVVDPQELIRRAVRAFRTELPDLDQDYQFLQECAERITPWLSTLPRKDPYFGMVHGDVIRANGLVTDSGSVSILDFDFCGPGWRVYDVATFLNVIRGLPDEEESEKAFLRGYESERPMSPEEHSLIPVFEVARGIFSIGVSAMNIYHWGRAYFDAYLPLKMNRIRLATPKIPST